MTQDEKLNKLFERIKRKIKVAKNGCWNWQGGKNPYGYGVGKATNICGYYYVHRFVFELMKGPTNGLCVLHKCDNRTCCNPDHLFLGTRADNYADCKAKDRHQRGERSPKSKLTDKAAKVIRRSKLKGATLAAMFGVSESAISKVRCGRSWKHIDRVTTKRKGA